MGELLRLLMLGHGLGMLLLLGKLLLLGGMLPKLLLLLLGGMLSKLLLLMLRHLLSKLLLLLLSKLLLMLLLLLELLLLRRLQVGLRGRLVCLLPRNAQLRLGTGVRRRHPRSGVRPHGRVLSRECLRARRQVRQVGVTLRHDPAVQHVLYLPLPLHLVGPELVV